MSENTIENSIFIVCACIAFCFLVTNCTEQKKIEYKCKQSTKESNKDE